MRYPIGSEDLVAIGAMIYREIKRYLRSRSRVMHSFIQPLFWFFFFGLGWSAAFRFAGGLERIMFGGLTYLEFLAPGVIMMSVFMSSFMGGIAVIWDREFGFLKELLVAPASREAIMLGRILGGALVATIHGTLMLALLTVLLGIFSPIKLGLVILVMIVTGLIFGSMGTLVASRMKSPEGFQLIVGLITMPLLFLSGAFFPLDPLPGWMKTAALLDPLTYCVELARGFYVGYIEISYNLALAGILASSIVMLGLSMLSFRRTYFA